MTIRICAALTLACTLFLAATGVAQVPGQNVNMVSGREWPYGDPFLERQNEPSIAVSTRNAQHLLAGANDYRTVDLNLPELLPNEPDATNQFTAEPWVGQYISIDGGARWQSTLLPGYRQDPSCQLSPHSPLCGFTTAADPVVRAGTNGMFYYAGIAFDRGTSFGLVFVARFMDLNDKENGKVSQNGLPIQYINTVPVAYGSVRPEQFLDKPWLAVDIPRGTATCTVSVPQPGSGTVPQTIPAGNVYVAYANVTQSGATPVSTVYFSRSTNCGANWSTPQPISQRAGIAQGANIQIDPETGWVYVVWRVIHNGTTQLNDGMAGVASFDGGHSFTPPLTLVSLPPFNPNNPNGPSFFDQNTSGTTFRSTAFPTMAVADSGIPFVPGPIYVAWSQRGAVPGTPDARIMMLSLPGSIMLSPAGIRLTPFAVDNGAVTNDLGGTFSSLTRGHQLMPSMTFNQGKLMLVYYDLRQDHTYADFVPTNLSGGELLPDAKGNFFAETRFPTGDTDLAVVFTPVINDADPPLTERRHTMDLTLAQSRGGALPTFTYARVSRYDFGLFEGDASATLHQLKFNPPNLPMFMQGQVAFTGDYVDVGGQMFTLVKCGTGKCWTYNNPLPPNVAGTFLAAPKPAPASAVHYATWASNQDVVAPKDGDWSKHTVMPLMGATSVYSPGTALPNCAPGTEGDRNQNVYSSRITQGLLVSSPQNSKPLSATIERGFVVLVQNYTTQLPGRYFRMTIANQPVGGFASFSQLVPPSPVPSRFPTSVNGMPFPLTSIDVTIGAHSGISRTVFAVSTNPVATIAVNVNEITGLGGTVMSGGLSGFLVLNADGTVPPNLVDPNGSTNPNTSITNVELYDPAITGPAITGPAITGPAITGPAITGPAITGNNVTSPAITGPAITGPAITGPAITGTAVQDPAITGPAITGSPVSDGTYTLTNPGNTGAAYNIKLVGCDVSPCKDTPLQLVMSQIYTTPGTNGNCELNLQQQSITLSNVPTAAFTPINQLGNPAITGTSVTDASINLPPGDTALITLRGHVDQQTLGTILTQVTPAVVPQAIDSNNTTATTPTAVLPVFITTFTLPNGIVGQAYPTTTLQAIGGTLGVECDYQWSWTGNPPGLNLVGNTISGTPTASGTYNVQVQVVDCAEHSAIRMLSINIIPQLFITRTALSSSVVGIPYQQQQLNATGGIPPYCWSLSPNTCANGTVSIGKTGFTLDAAGRVGGTPQFMGNNQFTVYVMDSARMTQIASRLITMSVSGPIINPTTLADGTVGSSYTASLLVTGGVGTVAWSVPSGTLPPGLVLDGLAGQISGTPTSGGIFNFTAQLTDSNGNYGTQALTLRIVMLRFGDLLVADGSPSAGSGTLLRITSTGASSTIASIPNGSPTAVAVDANTGNIYVAVAAGIPRVVKISRFGQVSDFVRGGILHGPVAVAVDNAGNVYVGDNNTDAIYKFNSAGTQVDASGNQTTSTFVALPSSPDTLQDIRMVFDQASPQNLFVASDDVGDQLVQVELDEFSPTGQETVLYNTTTNTDLSPAITGVGGIVLFSDGSVDIADYLSANDLGPAIYKISNPGTEIMTTSTVVSSNTGLCCNITGMANPTSTINTTLYLSLNGVGGGPTRLQRVIPEMQITSTVPVTGTPLTFANDVAFFDFPIPQIPQ